MRSPVASRTPSGLNSMAVTHSVCFFISYSELAVGRAVDADDLARPAEGDQAVVGADVGGEHGVVFLADLEDALARLHVPDDRQARLPAPAAAGQQQVAVAAELQDV